MADQDQDSELRATRLAQFLKWMLPIAVVFLVSYVALAVLFRNAALAVGAVAVLVYAVALAIAQRAAKRGDAVRAALLSGYSLQLMLVIGAVALRYQFAALLIIGLAGVAIVLPFIHGAALRNYMVVALVVAVWIVTMDFILPPLFEQPPEWYQQASLVLAVVAAFALTLRMLWVDAARLRLSLARAEDAVRVREEFLAVASHELNTPLTPLKLRLDMLAQAASKKPGDDFAVLVARHVDGSRQQLRRLADLVRDLLDVSRLSAGQLTLRTTAVDLAELIRSVAVRYELPAQQAGCRLEVTAPPSGVHGEWDAARVDQIIDNLLSNSLKYGAGKPVRVEVRASDGQAIVAVHDQGIGIAKDAQSRIFERFERAVSSAQYGGLGLGLYISRTLAWSMGGDIAVESEAGATSFTLTIPLRPTSTKGSQPALH